MRWPPWRRKNPWIIFLRKMKDWKLIRTQWILKAVWLLLCERVITIQLAGSCVIATLLGQ